MGIVVSVSWNLPFLEFNHVSYQREGRVILDDLSLTVERGEVLVLLGRSGSGKTTALRLMNRLLQPTSGAICLDGQNIASMDPITLRRKTGYVIQEFGLMPHWTVQQNVELPLRLLGWPEDNRHRRSRELLAQVDLAGDEMAQRKPHQLSGGQRQRVGVARALAAEPHLLLFDEPFGALDPVTRHEMQQQLLTLVKRYEVAAIFVTHDIAEALKLGTRIAVLAEGKLECLLTTTDFAEVQTPVARAFLDTLPAALNRAAAV